MKKIIALIHFVLAIHFCFGQGIKASYLQIYTKPKAIVPIKNEGKAPDFTENSYSLVYEHFLKNKRHSLSVSYMKFEGCTSMNFEHGGFSNGAGDILAKGFCGVNLRRIDIDFAYLLTRPNKKFYLKSFAGAGLQWSRRIEADYWGEGLPVNGPSYFELEPMWVDRWDFAQIVPSAGFRTGFVFWKRLEIELGFQGVYAFRTYQKMYLKYQYKGEIQPTAEYASTGTGLFVTLGIGYRFAKLIDRKKNK